MGRLSFATAWVSFTLLGAPLAWSGEPECTGWQPAQKVGTLSIDAVDESSGLAASWLRADLIWTHNDSGDTARLFALRTDGEVLTELTLTGAGSVDWEDMAIAACAPDDAAPCIYVADIGDNNARREHVSIYRFAEPDLGTPAVASLVIDQFEELRFTYAGGPRDAETLLVHPQTGAIYIVEKNATGQSQVFRVAPRFGEAGVVAEPIATLHFDHLVAFGRMTTGGDVSPDGREFTLRTYTDLYTYCAPSAEAFEAAFQATPIVSAQRPLTIQGEALTYDRQDNALWLTSEQLPAPLLRVPRQERVEPDPSQADPEPDAPDATPISGLDANASPDDFDVQTDTTTAQDIAPAISDNANSSSCSCAMLSSSRRANLALFFVTASLLVLGRRGPRPPRAVRQ
ncbi:MAG: hypothetical protein H0U74_22840 [Bradymonadaceae bacterium]|nr:hypothetical protein [Lujinxingiaceae bacterium]